MLEFRSAGESHGRAIIAVLHGLPMGLELDTDFINSALRRRQGGYGRSERQKIEKDRVEILSGVYRGRTLGSPLTLVVGNRDVTLEKKPPVKIPRPGHADLAGMLKYGLKDARAILERASARSTAGRVAVGAVCQLLLKELGIEVVGYVKAIGEVRAPDIQLPLQELLRRREESSVFMLDRPTAKEAEKAIDRARSEGDSLGGVVEVIALGVPAGIGSHTEWDRRLDGRLARALMSIQAIKAVEIGLGFLSASRPGSQVHDEILYENGEFARTSNNAGGIEGGISNGERIVVRAYMKPIPTLLKPLRSVNIETREPAEAVYERSDVCAVPACSVVAESAVAFEIARALLEKFPSDTMDELKTSYRSYLNRLEEL